MGIIENPEKKAVMQESFTSFFAPTFGQSHNGYNETVKLWNRTAGNLLNAYRYASFIPKMFPYITISQLQRSVNISGIPLGMFQNVRLFRSR